MTDLTRLAALTRARVEYDALAQRAIAVADDPDTLRELMRQWDAQLEWLGSLGSNIGVTGATATVLERLTQTVRRADLDATALVEWVDAFPDAVADLFPPSAATFRLCDEDNVTVETAEALTAEELAA